jgi:osmotically-inducible protein OsmY
MAEAPASISRPDADIAADIQHLITRYPPMMNDRRHVHYRVENGHVIISGNTRTSITRRYLVENVRQLPGVRGVDADRLHDDETIRREVARLMPVGVLVTVEYGQVILIRRLPADIDQEALTAKVAAVPGVRGVLSRLM